MPGTGKGWKAFGRNCQCGNEEQPRGEKGGNGGCLVRRELVNAQLKRTRLHTRELMSHSTEPELEATGLKTFLNNKGEGGGLYTALTTGQTTPKAQGEEYHVLGTSCWPCKCHLHPTQGIGAM